MKYDFTNEQKKVKILRLFATKGAVMKSERRVMDLWQVFIQEGLQVFRIDIGVQKILVLSFINFIILNFW